VVGGGRQAQPLGLVEGGREHLRPLTAELDPLGPLPRRVGHPAAGVVGVGDGEPGPVFEEFSALMIGLRIGR
jgi:hypothetical protein